MQGTILFMANRASKPLAGKVALVTGGARRLGRASALALAEAGADVAITFRKSAPGAGKIGFALKKAGGRARVFRCDVTDPKSVAAAVKAVVKKLGGIDILVNNALNYETVEFEDLTLAQGDAIFPSNVRGP